MKSILNKTILTNPKKKKNSPTSAKLVLIIFGLGPLVLMGLFLYSNGFFNSPSL